MILAQVRDELNQVNRLLDEYDTLLEKRRNRDERGRLLKRAGFASMRGVEALIEDQRTREFLPLDDDVYRLLEEMRQDEATLRLFIKTEMRLLEDLGVTREAIKKIEASLGDVLLELGRMTTPAEAQLRQLLDEFEGSLNSLFEEGREREILSRLSGVVQALGGALIVGANGVAGLGLAGVTVAVSAAGAAISIAAGTEVMTTGAAKALGA